MFVTPGTTTVSGALKNAVDSLGPEWTGKTIRFRLLRADGGIRSVEQWRQIVANFMMLDVRAQVSISVFAEFGTDGFRPSARAPARQELSTLLDRWCR